MNKLRVALIGLGGRGAGLYRETLKFREDVEWVAFCDTVLSRCEEVAAEAESEGKTRPAVYADYKKCIGNIEECYEKYDHPIWKKQYENVNGHGGIDERCLDGFFEALKTGAPMPIDVYDMATWMCITTLSEQSIDTGLPVAVPDFTNGAWVRRKNDFAK